MLQWASNQVILTQTLSLSFHADDGFLNLMNNDGVAKDDVKIPDNEVGEAIQAGFDDGKDLLVTIVAAMGEEQAMSFKEAPKWCKSLDPYLKTRISSFPLFWMKSTLVFYSFFSLSKWILLSPLPFSLLLLKLCLSFESAFFIFLLSCKITTLRLFLTFLPFACY